eukprot:RCo053912
MVHYHHAKTASMESTESVTSVVVGPSNEVLLAEDDIDALFRSSKLSLQSPLWRHWAATCVFLLLCGFAMSFSVSWVHFKMPDPTKYPPLPDIIHDHIPMMEFGALGELLFAAGLPLSLASGLYYIRQMFFPLWCKFFMAWGYSWLARSVALMATQLPPTTDYQCRFNYPNYPKDFPHPLPGFAWNVFIGVVSGGAKNVHCGDLMFSGHTVLVCMNWMFMLTYIMPHNRGLAALSTVISVAKLCFMVIQRQHYLIDVLVSAFVTISIFRATPERTPGWMNAIVAGLCRCLGGSPLVPLSWLAAKSSKTTENCKSIV